MNFVIFLCMGFFVQTAVGYTNPVQSVRDSPDPGVLWDGHYYYAATTGGWDQNKFPIWRSSNLANWENVGFGFVTNPIWTNGNDFWAP